MAKRNEKLRVEAENEDSLPPQEKPNVRKRKSSAKGKAAGDQQSDSALPGWAKARQAAERNAGTKRPVKEKPVLKHQDFGMTVGGVKSRKTAETSNSRFFTTERPRHGGGFSSSRNSPRRGV
jgi:hypothetical protein